MRWPLLAATLQLLTALGLPEDDNPATPDYVELELGSEPARNRTRWDARFVDPADGRFVAKIMDTFILSKDLTRSFDYRIVKPALDIAVRKVGLNARRVPGPGSGTRLAEFGLEI
ncbi:unnamed protein product [Ixodes pacificus]